MDGWKDDEPSDGLRVWRNPEGDVLSFASSAYLETPPLRDLTRVRYWCRDLAESASAGLIEVNVSESVLGPTLCMIYKKLKMPAYSFTGMLFVPIHDVPHVWTVVSGERGTTGVREAIITAELMESGKLSIDEYQRSWAQDPYEPEYTGVDRSVLRFVSDDPCYDNRFPNHPLTTVRKVLAALPHSVRVEDAPL
jgi:hypothetical protein